MKSKNLTLPIKATRTTKKYSVSLDQITEQREMLKTMRLDTEIRMLNIRIFTYFKLTY